MNELERAGSIWNELDKLERAGTRARTRGSYQKLPLERVRVELTLQLTAMLFVSCS